VVLRSPSSSRPASAGRSRGGKRIRRAVAAAVSRWQGQGSQVEPPPRDPRGTLPSPGSNVFKPLPRPGRLSSGPPAAVSLPRREPEVFSARWWRVLWRFFVWLAAAAQFFAGILWDALRRKNTIERRAKRLLNGFQKAGITFVKLGQQLSLRVDLIGYTYAHQLEKLLEDAAPFDPEEAVAIVQRTLGDDRPFSEVFSAFDKEPIGSASVACVYQAVLRDGRRVAVKVRRPGIGPSLAADMRALAWLLQLLELVWLPPGFSRNFTYELRTMLMEELDFALEARLTDLFRRRVEKAKLRFVTAPRIHFELSSREVLVLDFVSGVWLTDLLQAVEQQDVARLAELRAADIDPRTVARRYLETNRFGGFENIFFHADLHPANVLVQPGNKLVLIDFGACGAFPKRELHIWRRVLETQSHEDVGGMVHAVLALLEPLPRHIDTDELARRLESLFWKDLYAIKSKHSAWWERTSANVWISFLGLVHEYLIPLNLNTLRMIRATMIADTVAARLDSDIDPYREYRRYEKGRGKRARKRLGRRIEKALLGPRVFNRLEQIYEAGTSVFFRVQRFLDTPFLNWAAVIGKAAYGVKLLLNLLGAVLFSSAALTLILAVYLRLTGHAVDVTLPPGTTWPAGTNPETSCSMGHTVYLRVIFVCVLNNPWYQAAMLLAALSAVRRLIYRLRGLNEDDD
jgi:ubiquinone biosynthesis protein